MFKPIKTPHAHPISLPVFVRRIEEMGFIKMMNPTITNPKMPGRNDPRFRGTNKMARTLFMMNKAAEMRNISFTMNSSLVFAILNGFICSPSPKALMDRYGHENHEEGAHADQRLHNQDAF